MKNANVVVITLILVFGLMLIVYSALTHHSQIIVGGKTFIIDAVQSKYSMEKGLSGKDSLSDNEGMLFIFKKPDIYGIWMKDMKFPIDIIWIDSNMQIVSIEKSVSPDTYPQIFKPTTAALYVLEISAGQSNFLNLKIGDKVSILKK
jgi:uncharacterized membrane protein (UPF0127 family)